MTEEQIIKALACCGSPYNRCFDCPLCEMERVKCFTELTANALYLINHQKTNAEGLTNALKYLNEQVSSAKAEAYKEFADLINPVEDLKKAIEEIENRPLTTAEMQKESNKRCFGLYMTNDEVLEHWSKQRGDNNA